MQAVEGMRKMQATENGQGSGKQEGASMSDAKSAEIVGTILEHLNREIASLRETVHLLQRRAGVGPVTATEATRMTTSIPSRAAPSLCS